MAVSISYAIDVFEEAIPEDAEQLFSQEEADHTTLSYAHLHFLAQPKPIPRALRRSGCSRCRSPEEAGVAVKRASAGRDGQPGVFRVRETELAHDASECCFVFLLLRALCQTLNPKA